jgi:hypothetical protein
LDHILELALGRKKKPWRKKRKNVVDNGCERKMSGEIAEGEFIKINQEVK